jgi:hypothetical protein
MTTFDVLNRYGTAALLRFVGLVVLFCLLHLARLPLVLLARVLEVSMRRVDGAALRQTSRSAGRPVNQFFTTPNPTPDREEALHV